MASAFDDPQRAAAEASVDGSPASGTLNSDRRTTDRRASERRRLAKAGSAHRSSVSGAIGGRRSDDALATLEALERIAVAVDALNARVADLIAPSIEKPTCTVEEAAALLGTTTRGIYALHERGKLPPTVGPGRRLLWRRDDLLQCRRRASSPGKDRR